MYRVAIKASAAAGSRIGSIAEGPGSTVEFPSAAHAERFVADLDDAAPALRLQAPAPQDPAEVDAYLVRDGQVNEWEPVSSTTAGVTFPVGGNVYGTIGRALIAGGGAVSPPLRHYFSESVPPAEQGRVTEVVPEPGAPADLAAAVAWQPDLRIAVATDGDETATYYAEVKSGNASFERCQRRDMQRVAETYRVLRIRVELAALPEQYTVRIDAVSPDRWPS